MVPVSLNLADTAMIETTDVRQAYMKRLQTSKAMHLACELPDKQQWPPVDSDGFVTPCESAELRSRTVQLFREQFSPDMHDVFPLLCASSKGFGLDFTSCHTWLVFGEVTAG